MAYDSWYCQGPSWITDRISSCVPTAADQAAIMRGNFGPAADPTLVGAAVNDFSTYLTTSGYDANVSSAKCQDSIVNCSLADLINTYPWVVILLGVVATAVFIPMVSDSGPRRYGR